MSFGSNTSTSEMKIPNWLEGAGKDVVKNALEFYDKDFKPYKGDRVAEFTDTQESGFQNVINWSNQTPSAYSDALGITKKAAAAPGYQLKPTGPGYQLAATPGATKLAPTAGEYKFDEAGPGYQLAATPGATKLAPTAGEYTLRQAGPAYSMGETGGAYKPEDYGRIVDEGGKLGAMSDYINPYVSANLDPVIKDIERAAAKERMRIGDMATAAGAYGDARHGVLEGESDRNRVEAIGEAGYRAYSDAWNAGMAARQADLTRFGNRDLAEGQFYENQQGRQLARDTTQGQFYENQQARQQAQDQAQAGLFETAAGRRDALNLNQAGLDENAANRALSRDVAQGSLFEQLMGRRFAQDQAQYGAHEAYAGRSDARSLNQAELDANAASMALSRDVAQGSLFEQLMGRRFAQDTAQAGLYETAQNRALAGGAQMTDIQGAADESMLQRLMAQLNVGATQQANAQAELDAKYEGYDRKRQDEYDRLAALVSVIGGVPYTRTGITTQPNNDIWKMLGSVAGGLIPG